MAYYNFSAITGAARRIGWGLVLIMAIYFSGIAFNSLAWRMLFVPERPGLIKILFIVRWIRESINYLLPSALLGGDVIGARLLVARGRDVSTVSGTVVADKTLEAAGLFFFSLTGLLIMLGRRGNISLKHWEVLGLAGISAVLIIFLMAQRWGMLRVADKIVSKLARKCGGALGSADTTGIYDTVWAIYANRPRLALSIFLHTLAWMVPGALQIWVALHFMGHEIGLTEAFIIESFSQVIIAAAFIMPAALGAQEVAYMTIGMLFGVPPAMGLALSVVIHLKDLLVGIPGLLIWQGLEGRRLWLFWKK
jgi:putative membrane protein